MADMMLELWCWRWTLMVVLPTTRVDPLLDVNATPNRIAQRRGIGGRGGVGQKALRGKFHECQEVWYGVHDLQKVRAAGGTVGQSGCGPPGAMNSMRLTSRPTHTYLAPQELADREKSLVALTDRHDRLCEKQEQMKMELGRAHAEKDAAVKEQKRLETTLKKARARSPRQALVKARQL